MSKNTTSNPESERELREVRNFSHACEILGISEYEEEIYKSNSHGELAHTFDYILLAQGLDEEALQKFPAIFEEIVNFAKEEWKRPQSVYQHIIPILTQHPEA